jgi:DNA-binding CsgD family transcriptional regulator
MPQKQKQHSSKCQLNQQQLRLVRLVAEGRSDREIARIIGRTEEALQEQLRQIQDKLRLSHRLELVLWYAEHAQEP